MSGADLAAIVHKCTRADLVVLGMERLADRATFTRPHRFPDGVDLVLVAGTTVVTAGEHTGAAPGTVVRRAER